MGLKFLKSLHKDGNNKYDDFLTMLAPITAEQKGDGTSPAQVTAYLINDGKRYDPTFDIPQYPSGRPMTPPNQVTKLGYNNIVIYPRGYGEGTDQSSWITIKGGLGGSSAATKLWLSDNSHFGVGTVLICKNGANQTEKMLVLDYGVGIAGDTFPNQPYVTVKRQFMSAATPLSFNDGDRVWSDVSHIRLAKQNPITYQPGTFGTGGAALAMDDIMTDVLNDGTYTPAPFYIMVDFVTPGIINATTGVPTIPTQVKTDVYFEVTSKEIPR